MLYVVECMLTGLPRFGEPGAKGWCNVHSSQYTTIPAPLKPTGELFSPDKRNRALAWLITLVNSMKYIDNFMKYFDIDLNFMKYFDNVRKYV